ncbi:MAG: hypothetical protein R3C10_11320 [Pirellulales bacterium]|nr:hypothetical protein [Planctomycetales bacterium]
MNRQTIVRTREQFPRCIERRQGIRGPLFDRLSEYDAAVHRGDNKQLCHPPLAAFLAHWPHDLTQVQRRSKEKSR